MGIFTLNGKEYKSKPFDYNLICELEELGLPLQQLSERPMSMVRAYVSICAGKGKSYAGKEIESHIINGGTLDELNDIISKEIERSDFFQAMADKKKKEETPAEEKSENV